MNVREAMEFLGFLGTALNELRADDVRAAFAQGVKEAHPDSGRSIDHPYTIKEMKQARDVLLQEIATQNNACALCCGTGKVRGKIGMQGCSACEGTGERK